MSEEGTEHRQYPRVKAPIYCRPARLRMTYRLVLNFGLGGVRIYSDEQFKIGDKLELDLLLPERTVVTCIAEVSWFEALPADAPARYDVGLKFLQVPQEAIGRMSAVLDYESRS